MLTEYKFAWSKYYEGQPIYYAVKNDFTIFSSDNWETFFAETQCYCSDLKWLVNLYLTSEEGKEHHTPIYAHKYFSLMFTVGENKITIVDESEVTYYPSEDNPEARHWAGMATYNERNSY